MPEENKPRIRLNAKMTSKGEMQLDVTVETYDLNESADIRVNRLVMNIKELEDQLKAYGYKIAGQQE